MEALAPTENTLVTAESTTILPRIAPRTQRHAIPTSHLAPGTYLVVEDEGNLVAIPILEGVTRIGRSFAAEIRLEDLSLSRRHAILVHGSGETVILDDRSANGTFLNGERVLRAAPNHGDVIVLGSTVMHFVVQPDLEESPATATPASQTG
jgi:pSer/pThr/pTyr-binding forkhead associated (FHA) protein